MSNFAMIPVDVMLKLETKLEWAAWAAIALHWGPNKPQVFAYQKNMAQSVGLSVDALGTGIKRLRDKGLIEVLRTRNGNRYRLPSLENPRVPEDEHTPETRVSKTKKKRVSDTPKTRVSETSEKGVSDTPKKRDYKEQTIEQTKEQTKEQTTEQTKRKRSAPAPVATEAQELWDHWRKLNPKIRKKEPPQDQTRHLSAALDCFTVAELKQALNGVNPMVATWSSPRPPQFKFAFTKLDKDAGKTAFVEERVHEAIGHYQNAAAERVKPQMEAAIKRLMSTEDTPSDGPKTHKGRKVLGWFAATDSTGAERFKWAKLAEYDDGISCKRAFALRAMLENTESPAARQLIETALVDADWRVRDAISIDDQRAKDRQRAEEKRKRMEAEYEAAGCPIYEVEELPF